MSDVVCPSCGNPLQTDALSGEIRPCSRCGSVRGMPSEKPVPDPEHQHRIKRQKIFEIGAVMVMIVVGVGYFAISNRASQSRTVGPITMSSFSNIVFANDFEATGDTSILGHRFRSYSREEPILWTSLDIISAEDDEAVEALLIVVSHPGGTPFPTDEVAERAIQEGLDEMADLCEHLIPSSNLALQKAVITMSAGKEGVLHNKGVAQTSDGWKVTYITYREYEETGEDIPLLLFLYQRLSAASDPELGDFNRVLYESINSGTDAKAGLRAYEAGLSSE